LLGRELTEGGRNANKIAPQPANSAAARAIKTGDLALAASRLFAEFELKKPPRDESDMTLL